MPARHASALRTRRAAQYGRTLRLLACTVAAAALLAGCASLPTNGPSAASIRSDVTGSVSLPYAMVKVTPAVIATLQRSSTRFARVFNDTRGPSEIRFGTGDVVAVTLFESMPGGLFIPLEAGVRPGNFIQLPHQAVDTAGYITVPYGGRVMARGHTITELQDEIVKSLKDRAIEPQAVVSLIDQRASSVSVLGEVGTPSRFPASASGERVLDAIARAGGPRNPGYDTWVLLERDGRQASVPFGALIEQKSNNVYVRPQDTIYVFTQPQTFVAFGGSGLQGQFPFAAWRLSLAEAMAKAGGLHNDLADPASVFLYRGETRKVAEELGIDCAHYSSSLIPVIYNINLRDPSGYFLATSLEMRNKDVIFASNAPTVEQTKFLVFLRMVIGTVNDPLMAGVNAFTIKSLATGQFAPVINTTPTPAIPAPR